MLTITMPRGDIRLVRFQVTDTDGSASQTDFTEIFFTVKKAASVKRFLFQKTLSGGEIIKIDVGDYQFRIEPEDTDGLNFGRYDCDIELVYEDQIKQTECGTLEITKEVTHASNEG